MGKKQKLAPREVQSFQTFKDPSEVVAINTVKLTEVQIKTWLAMLYASRNNFTEECHIIPVAELNELSGYGKKDLKYLKEAMTKFCQTVVRFNTLGKSKQNYGGVITSLLAGADFDKHPGYVEFAFSPMLKRVVQNSKMFSNLSLALVRNMETKSGLALYRIINDYRGVHTTPEIPLKTLREILGVEESEYPSFKDFNKWVLKPACKQVKDKTDLEPIPHFFRGAHGKVTSVKFEIKEQKIPLLVKRKPLNEKKGDEGKRKESKNPYGHLTEIEARSELLRITTEENQTQHYTAESQTRKAFLREQIKALGGAI
jgi:plasmid replication initiation protein